MRNKLLLASVAMAASMAFAGGAMAKTLVYCTEGSPETFNPALTTAGTTLNATAVPVYNTLIQIEWGGTAAVPGLAESWSFSDDGLVMTLNLRKGVKWHTTANFTPSREFNADDVVFTFERMLKADHPWHPISGATYDYFNDVGMPGLLASIEKVDDYTVNFHLTAKNSTLVSMLTLGSFSITSAEYADQMMAAGTPEKLDLEPVGTGPFAWVSYETDTQINYVANPTYWEGAPKIDELIFSITPDNSVRYAKMQAGECHFMAYPNPADIESMKADANLQVAQQEGFNIGYLAFNTEKAPFNDKLVRQAISHAIDKAAIMEAVYQGAGTPATNFIPPSLWSYNKDVADVTYDPELARKLLAEAGVPEGFKATLWYLPVQRPYNPNGKLMGELMQADLAKVGIAVELVTYEWAEYRKRVRAGEHDLVMLGWTGDYGDPDNFFGALLSCAAAPESSSRWCYEPFDSLITQSTQINDLAERTKLYEQAQVIFKEEAPVYTVAHSLVTEIMAAGVSGYKMSPFGAHDFKFADIAE